MTNRDVALIAFRTLALWVVVSNFGQALGLLLSWKQLIAPVEAGGSPTWELLLWGVIGALARSAIGIVVWALARPLSWLLFPGEAETATTAPPALSLYRSASFLVGLWLLADAIPTAVYYTAWAVWTGWRPAHGEEGAAQTAELVAKLLLGVALLRGDWLIRTVRREEDGEATVKEPQPGP